jgi:hypothetical protein
VGEWAATSPHSLQVSKQSQREEGAPPLGSVGCHLKGAPPLQEGRTSQYPCANIFKDMESINCQSSDLVPFDSLLTFAFNFASTLSPLSFLFLTWLIFIELK